MRSPLPRSAIEALQRADQEADQRRAEYQARARAQRQAEVTRQRRAIESHEQLATARREAEDAEVDFEGEVIRVRCAGEGPESLIELAEARLARARRELGIAQIAHQHWQSPGFR